MFTDDDCAPRSDWLAAIHRWTSLTTQPTAIGGQTINVLADDIYATASQGIVDYLYEYYGHHHAAVRFFTTNNLVVPREEFLEIGGFDERFHRAAAEDRDLCERWRRHGLPLQYADDVVVSHAHALTFARFNRMHFNYGRGAFDLHRSRARRGQRGLRLEPVRFYYGLITYPLRSRGWRGVLLAFLHFWSQVAYAAGYFWERSRAAGSWSPRSRNRYRSRVRASLAGTSGAQCRVAGTAAAVEHLAHGRMPVYQGTGVDLGAERRGEHDAGQRAQAGGRRPRRAPPPCRR